MASVATDLMTSRQSSLWLHRNNLGASGVAAWKQSHYLICKVCMRQAVFSPLEEVVVVWVAGGCVIFQSAADFPSFFFFFFFFLVPRNLRDGEQMGTQLAFEILVRRIAAVSPS
jgi:hypothetical protein